MINRITAECEIEFSGEVDIEYLRTTDLLRTGKTYLNVGKVGVIDVKYNKLIELESIEEVENE